MSPLVSVLVTVYNREQYLAECLASILASTFGDFEVVIVDDRSSDRSLAVAEKFAAEDDRIRIAKNERNLGDYPNRMRAAALANGRYIKYVDSDDVIYPHSLGLMVESMEANRDAALGLSHHLPDDICPYPWKLSQTETWKKEFLGDGCLGCGPTGAIIDRERFNEVGGFRDWGVLSDTDLWYRMTACWPLLLLPPGLVWWRRHDEQEFTRDSAAIVYLEKGFQLARESLASADNPMSCDETSDALDRVKQHHARRLISLAVRRGQPRLALRLLRQSGLASTELLQGFSAYR